jgi:hypothetical protein
VTAAAGLLCTDHPLLHTIVTIPFVQQPFYCTGELPGSEGVPTKAVDVQVARQQQQQ